jgi:hypothetical protein
MYRWHSGHWSGGNTVYHPWNNCCVTRNARVRVTCPNREPTVTPDVGLAHVLCYVGVKIQLKILGKAFELRDVCLA